MLPEIVVFSTMPPASPIEYSPPPRPVSSRGPKRARLLAISEPRITSVESDALAKPPPFSALLSVIVVSTTVNSLLDVLWMPPPLPVAVLPVTSTRVNVTRSPLFSTPPPPASSPRAWFSRITVSVTRTVPDPSMPSAPPSPWASLRSNVESVTVNGPDPPVCRPPPVPSPSTGRPSSSTELTPATFSRNSVSTTEPDRSPSKMTAPPLPDDWLPTNRLSVTIDARATTADDGAALVGREVLGELGAGDDQLAVAAADERAAGRLDVVLVELAVGDLDQRARAGRGDLALGVDGAAVVGPVALELAVVDRQRAARRVDRAAGRLGDVAGEVRLLDGDDAVAAVVDRRAVARRGVGAERGAAHDDRADRAHVGLVVDRPVVDREVGRVGEHDPARVGRIGDDRAGVLGDDAVLDDDRPGAHVVDRRAAGRRAVAGQRRVDHLETTAADDVDAAAVRAGVVVEDADVDEAEGAGVRRQQQRVELAEADGAAAVRGCSRRGR